MVEEQKGSARSFFVQPMSNWQGEKYIHNGSVCLWTVSGPWLRGHEALAVDDDWVRDEGAEVEVDRKCVLHQPGNQWCRVEIVLKS